ncbi:MAG: hypothetical protein LUD68_09415 [Rikenellaceae bacterium]|nr:hypothetical protein [Rikenellaceae bacterium]
MKNFLILLLFSVNLAGILFYHRKRPEKIVVRQTDTVWIDTVIRDTLPVPWMVEVVRYRIDTIYRVDSLPVPVSLPVERKEYRTGTYRAVVQGYRPELLSMEVFQRMPVITHTHNRYSAAKSRWGIGLQAGYGLVGNKWSPYLGVGIQYRLVTF